jgi:hypothetical protein
VVNRICQIPFTRRHYSERDARFSYTHRCAFCSIEVGSSPDYLLGKSACHPILGQMPVTVHGVEVELGRVNYEVIVQVVRIRKGFEQSAARIKGYLRLAPITDARPRLGFLGGELDGYSVMRCAFLASLGGGDDAVVVTTGERYPRPDLMSPSFDFGVIGFISKR